VLAFDEAALRRVAQPFFADAERSAAERRLALACVWRDSAVREAAFVPSRLSTRVDVAERFAFDSVLALRFVLC
jgi:hypothetical protein